MVISTNDPPEDKEENMMAGEGELPSDPLLTPECPSKYQTPI